MGFLNKLFGNLADKATSARSGIRAQHKDAKFFEKMLQKKDGVIDSLSEVNSKLATEGKLEPFHYWSIAMENLDKFYITYSMGRPIDQCYQYFTEAADWYKKGWDKDAAYADMLDMVSLGYLLQVSDNHYEGIVNYIRQADAGSKEPEWKADGILWFIINARRNQTSDHNSVILPELYQQPLEITKMPKLQAEITMKKYLDNWYRLRQHSPWFDSHNKELSYKGYWSWESAAITKIMQLDDSSFKDNPYYPYDLVHWKKSIT